MTDETTVRIETFSDYQYVTKAFQRAARIDWRKHMENKFVVRVEGKGYYFVGDLRTHHIPWSERDMAEGLPEKFGNADRFRISAKFTPIEGRYRVADDQIADACDRYLSRLGCVLWGLRRGAS